MDPVRKGPSVRPPPPPPPWQPETKHTDGSVPYFLRHDPGEHKRRELSVLERQARDRKMRLRQLELDTQGRDQMGDRSQYPSFRTREGSSSYREKADMVLEPARGTKNVTVELELDIFPDVEDELEEFSRLRRLGRFTEANDFFQSKLTAQLENPYVKVQYAEMLLAQGDYTNFAAAVEDLDLHVRPNDPRNGYFEHYCQLLKVVRNRSASFRPDGTSDDWLGFPMPHLFEDGDVPFLHDFLLLCFRTVAQQFAEDDSYPKFRPSWLTTYAVRIWKVLYNDTISHGRVWDARDVVSVMIHLLSWPVVGKRVLEVESYVELVQRLLADWRLDGYDQATHLALIDLFTTLALQTDYWPASNQVFEALIKHAEALADTVMKLDAQSMQSRPLIQLIMAQSIRLAAPTPTESIDNDKGILLRQGEGVFLPIYVPFGTLMWPSWDILRLKPGSADSLSVALKIARQNGDYNSEATCLKLLIRTVDSPKRYLDELERLQKTVQNDQEGYFRTVLSSFLIDQDPTAQQQSMEKLKEFKSKECRPPLHSSLLWAEMIIVSQLSGKYNITAMARDRENRRIMSHIPDYVRDIYREQNIRIPRPKKLNPDQLSIASMLRTKMVDSDDMSSDSSSVISREDDDPIPKQPPYPGPKASSSAQPATRNEASITHSKTPAARDLGPVVNVVKTHGDPRRRYPSSKAADRDLPGQVEGSSDSESDAYQRGTVRPYRHHPGLQDADVVNATPPYTSSPKDVPPTIGKELTKFTPVPPPGHLSVVARNRPTAGTSPRTATAPPKTSSELKAGSSSDSGSSMSISKGPPVEDSSSEDDNWLISSEDEETERPRDLSQKVAPSIYVENVTEKKPINYSKVQSATTTHEEGDHSGRTRTVESAAEGSGAQAMKSGDKEKGIDLTPVPEMVHGTRLDDIQEQPDEDEEGNE